MGSGSKYETMANAIQKKIEVLNSSVEDVVKQKQLEAELERIDEETNIRIEEIKNTPINKELVKKQATNDRDATIKNAKRLTINTIQENERKLDNGRKQLELMESQFEQIKEQCKEQEEKEILNAENEYAKTISSIDNVAEVIKINIAKEKAEANKRKKQIKIDLSNVKIRNEAQTDKLESIETLYNDIKEISLKLGDK
jgi:hypothetical protein